MNVLLKVSLDIEHNITYSNKNTINLTFHWVDPVDIFESSVFTLQKEKNH